MDEILGTHSRTTASSRVAADNFALECWPGTLGRAFFTRAEREQGAGDPHSEIMRRALIGLLGNAYAVLHATETASGRSCLTSLSPSSHHAMFLITAGQRCQCLRCVALCRPSAAAGSMSLSLG
jgi:hypothetical protein